MSSVLWGLLGVFTSVWAPPVVQAVTPVPLALPQSVNYAQEMRQHVGSTAFSTNPRGRVAAQVDPEGAVGGNPALRVFITNNQTCTRGGDNLAYRIAVRNYGTTPATDITLQFKYPLGTSYLNASPLPLGDPNDFPADHILEWHADSLLPGDVMSVSAIIVNDEDLRSVTIPVTVFFNSGRVLTEHLIDGPCTNQLAQFAPATPGPSGTPLFPAVPAPALVCDPSEPNCERTPCPADKRLGCVPCTPGTVNGPYCLPTFDRLAEGLGPNYSRATTDPSKGPAICSGQGCLDKLVLGERFVEAIADIIPGDCRVLADDVIANPTFHDALNRRAKPAAHFLEPLRSSTSDFRQLVLENALLGIDNTKHAKDVLQAIHTKHWEKQRQPIETILRSSTKDDPSPDGATAAVRSAYEQWDNEWQQETIEAQKALLEAYDTMQEERKNKLAAVAKTAVINAKVSMRRACGREDDDGGLSPRLPGVKTEYDSTLERRVEEYKLMQQRFADANNSIFPQRNRATEWQKELKAALDAFDADNPKPLQEYYDSIPVKDHEGFAAAWQRTYLRHQTDDEAADNVVRLRHWESALDTPKITVASCEKDNVLPPSVETTWCESGSDPAVLPKEAPFPNQLPKLPPAPILGGERAVIDDDIVKGVACGGGPGDPYWAADCSCNCEQLIPSAASGVVFCRANVNITLPANITTDSDGNPLSSPEVRPQQVVRHDNRVTTRDECLWDGIKHEDPFF